MKKDPYGVFEVVIPARNGQPAIEHNSKIKVWSSLKLLLHLLTR
jgi:1,4-alpha-glucan branching enzyme